MLITTGWYFYDIVTCLPSEQEVKQLRSNSSGMYSERIVSHLCRGKRYIFVGFFSLFQNMSRKRIEHSSRSSELLSKLLPVMLGMETLQVMIYFY
jgi:hypothetical protein